jgi:hypothetical protein
VHITILIKITWYSQIENTIHVYKYPVSWKEVVDLMEITLNTIIELYYLYLIMMQIDVLIQYIHETYK